MASVDRESTKFEFCFQICANRCNVLSPSGGSLTVRNITNELVDIADWESVGVELGVSATKLSEIRANRMNNGPLCKISMADTWLRSDVNASWEKLADALDRTKNTPQAEHIRNNDLYYGVFVVVYRLWHDFIIT